MLTETNKKNEAINEVYTCQQERKLDKTITE